MGPAAGSWELATHGRSEDTGNGHSFRAVDWREAATRPRHTDTKDIETSVACPMRQGLSLRNRPHAENFPPERTFSFSPAWDAISLHLVTCVEFLGKNDTKRPAMRAAPVGLAANPWKALQLASGDRERRMGLPITCRVKRASARSSSSVQR
jgi:hypothetical protein